MSAAEREDINNSNNNSTIRKTNRRSNTVISSPSLLSTNDSRMNINRIFLSNKQASSQNTLFPHSYHHYNYQQYYDNSSNPFTIGKSPELKRKKRLGTISGGSSGHYKEYTSHLIKPLSKAFRKNTLSSRSRSNLLFISAESYKLKVTC